VVTQWAAGWSSKDFVQKYRQESRAVARKPRDAAAVLFGLKFADNIHYKFKSSQASKAMASELQIYRRKTEFNAKWPLRITFPHISAGHVCKQTLL